MRKYFILLVILFISISCSKKDKTQIRLSFPDLKKSTIVILEQRVDGAKILDTLSFSRRGKIDYSFVIKQPGFYNIYFEGGSKLYLLLHPNDNVKISGSNIQNNLDFKITGSLESDKLNTLYDSLFVTRTIFEQLQAKYNQTDDIEQKAQLQNEYMKLLDSYRKFSMQFVLENLTSLNSVAALYQEVGPDEFVFGRKRDLQFFKLATDSLTKYYPKNRHVQALKRNFQQMLESYQLQRILTSVDEVKEVLPNLELPDINGNLVSLNEMKKRYVLLNFWHPNDEVSHELFPELNSVYKKYNSKNFGIYNVYVGKSAPLWSRIVNFEEISNWINVADTSFPFSKTRAAYNIVAVPSNYLLDLNENNVVGKDLNPGQLNQVLSQLLK